MYKGPLTHSLHYSEFVELTLSKSFPKGGYCFSLLSILVSTPAGVEELRRWGVTIIKKWRRIILPHTVFELRLY